MRSESGDGASFSPSFGVDTPLKLNVASNPLCRTGAVGQERVLLIDRCTAAYRRQSAAVTNQAADSQRIELSPNGLPSVSAHRATQPNSPIENLGRSSRPPAADTRPASIAQSSTLK